MKFTYLDIKLDLGEELLAEALAPDVVRAAKLRALKRLGVDLVVGLTPLEAWLQFTSLQNDIPFTLPVADRLVDAIMADEKIFRFVNFLAGDGPITEEDLEKLDHAQEIS